jgi:putative spermidine/putrescine transport system permease protein
LTSTLAPQQGSAPRRTLLRRVAPAGGAVPFLLYTALFLLVPIVIILIGAFQSDGGAFTTVNFRAAFKAEVLRAIATSALVSIVSAVIGAVVGAFIAYQLSTAKPNGVLRRITSAASSVLAQFGGVMLGYAFIFTFLARGTVGRILTAWHIPLDSDFFSTTTGLIVVYCYFQIPLMVIIFLPAVDGIRPQWREANESLGGSNWVFWRRVAGPILAPSFLGSVLLLFTNAFSAFATAAVLINLTNPLITLQIKQALISETGLGAPNQAKAEAILMVIVVAVLMWAYYRIQRRSARWLG